MRYGSSIGKSIAEEIYKKGFTHVEIEALFRKCKNVECIYREIMQTELYDNKLDNCSYRYPETDLVTPYALWIDGPLTCIAALLSLVGARYAVKFLRRAGLNRELTAALFALCAIDSLLMICVVLFYGIEANSILFFDVNVMKQHQVFTYNLHGVASSLTTSSTMLVVYITFLRFMVVIHPLRYASSFHQNHKRYENSRRSVYSQHDQNDWSQLSRSSFKMSSTTSFTQIVRPFLIPICLIMISFAIHIPTYFEFVLVDCLDYEINSKTKNIVSTAFRENTTYKTIKAVQMTLTQTIGPVSLILILSILTEYRVHASLKARRKLFESQQRSREVVLTEEIKERVSKTVAIFIAVKFLIFRTGPIFFDVYESIYGIENWSVVMSVMVRVSDFGIVLNTATNCLAYFGKKRWIEKRLRLRIMRKEEKRNAKANSLSARSGSSTHPITTEKVPLVESDIDATSGGTTLIR